MLALQSDCSFESKITSFDIAAQRATNCRLFGSAMTSGICILCGKHESRLFDSENKYTAMKCGSCGLVYVDPKPALAELAKIYETDEASTTDIESFIKLKERKVLLARRALRAIRPFKSGGSILEIGSAAGWFLNTAREQGFEVHGIELNRHFVKFSKDVLGLDIWQGTISDCPYSARTFDVVYMRNVLSHLYDPVNDFTAINVMLKEKGILAFETGNTADLDPAYIRRMGGLGLPDHLFHFNTPTVRQLLEKTGFRLQRKLEYSLHYRELLYRRLGNALRLSYGELKTNTVDRSPTSSLKQKVLARIDVALLSAGRIMPTAGRKSTIVYIAQRM